MNTQYPEPKDLCAWCVPPARWLATPFFKASLQVNSVPFTAKNDLFDRVSDHINPNLLISCSVKLPFLIFEIYSLSCTIAKSSTLAFLFF